MSSLLERAGYRRWSPPYRKGPEDDMPEAKPLLSSLDELIQRHTGCYSDPGARAWVERRLRAWARGQER